MRAVALRGRTSTRIYLQVDIFLRKARNASRPLHVFDSVHPEVSGSWGTIRAWAGHRFAPALSVEGCTSFMHAHFCASPTTDGTLVSGVPRLESSRQVGTVVCPERVTICGDELVRANARFDPGGSKHASLRAEADCSVRPKPRNPSFLMSTVEKHRKLRHYG